jgi:uncharacterized radical SAM superfamily Fe-S cluster-containing enzyme
MNSRESFKEMVKMLKAERERLNEIAGLLNGKTTVGDDLIYCVAAKANIEEAYRQVTDALTILAFDYVKVADPEFYNDLDPDTSLDVYIEDGIGTERILIYGEAIEGNQISTTV